MMRLKLLVITFLSGLALVTGHTQAYDTQGGDKTIIGKKFSEIADLTVIDSEGKIHKLSELKHKDDILVLAFLSNNCPWSQGRRARLQALVDMYGAKGVQVIGMSANKPDKLADVIANARAGGAKFSIYRDETKSLAGALHAAATPHTFIFDKKGVLRYAGAFDDSLDPDKVKRKFAEDALVAVLEGKQVANPNPNFMIGCNIK